MEQQKGRRHRERGPDPVEIIAQKSKRNGYGVVRENAPEPDQLKDHDIPETELGRSKKQNEETPCEQGRGTQIASRKR